MIDLTLCYNCGKHFEEDDLVIELLHMESDESYFVHKKCFYDAVKREYREMNLPNMS